VIAQVGRLLGKVRFREFRLLADKYVSDEDRTLSGKWRLAIFYGALSDLLDISWPKDEYLPDVEGSCVCKRPDPLKIDIAEREWDGVYSKVEQWIHRYPNSPHARIVEAQFFVNRACSFGDLDSRRRLPRRRGRASLITSKMRVDR